MADHFDEFLTDGLDIIEETSENTDASASSSCDELTNSVSSPTTGLRGPPSAGFGTLPKVLSQLDRTCQETIEEEGTENDDSASAASGKSFSDMGMRVSHIGEDYGFSISPIKSPMRSPRRPKVTSETPAFDGNGSIMLFDFDGGSSNSSLSDSVSRLPTSLPIDLEEDELSWRLDPSRSLSDWTITVNNVGSRLSKSYHVHKNMLAVGKRKSPYFVDIFKQGKSKRETDLFFPVLASEAMPALLDYLYIGDEALALTSTTAPGLRYLAQFFGIKVLFEEIMQFIQTDLSLKTLTAYYTAAMNLEDRKILNVVSKHIVRNIALIEESHDIVEVMEPSFFMKVLSSTDLSKPENTVHTSILLAKYCKVWKGKLDKEAFAELTAEKYISQVYHGAALDLLESEAVVCGSSGDGQLTNLQARCIDALAPKWDCLCDVDPDRTRNVCNILPTYVVTELMMKSLTRAKRYSDKEIKAIKTAESEKRNYMTARLKSDYENLVGEMRVICADKERVIKMYTMELARFRRLPNSTSGKLTTSGRSGKATVLPEIARYEPDGYLLVNKKLNEKLPVFYYQ